MLENIKDTPTKSLSETNTILSSTVNEFLCNVGGGLHRLAWESNGIVGLTCPIEEEEKSESNKKVEIFIQIPLVDILSANKPGIAVIESLNRILDSHSSTPCFLFVRRVIQSNTSKWMFVTWVPEIFCDSNYSMFQIARIRNTILFNISSVHNITSSLCLSISDIRRLRQVLTCDLPDPIVDSLIGSRTAESYCNGVAELALPRTPLERLELLNTFRSLDDYQTNQPYLKNLPIRLSNDCKDTLQEFAKGECDAVVLRVDDTTSSVQVDETLGFQSPADLGSAFHLEEPRYYLLSWNNFYYLILHIPDTRDMALRFLYSLLKTTIKNQIEQLLGIENIKTGDLRQGESILWILQTDQLPATDVSEQVLLMSEISIRPRPSVTRMSVDPFLLVKSISHSNGQIEYIKVGARERFRF